VNKTCTKCSNLLDYSYFNKDRTKPDGYYSSCKGCSSKKNKDYIINNKIKLSFKNKERYKKDKEKILIKTNDYKSKNKDLIKIRNRDYILKRRQSDLLYRLNCNLRSRLSYIVNKKCNVKHTILVEYLGCELDFFKTYIENMFVEGMSWDNYGNNGWHIDHIVPISKASSLEEMKRLSHYSNLQPLWAEDNRKKSNKGEINFEY